jgi:hypothetical protein
MFIENNKHNLFKFMGEATMFRLSLNLVFKVFSSNLRVEIL